MDPGRHSKRKTEFVELFHMHETLFSGLETIVSSESYKWHFGFSFPFQTGPDRSGKYMDRGNPLFDEISHILPPRVGSSQSNEIKIEYPVYAIAKETFRGYGATEEIQTRPVVCNIKSLNFRPDVSHQGPPPTQQLTQRFSLSSQSKKVLGGLRRTSATSLADGEEGDISIAAELPSQASFGDPLTLSFTHTSSRDLHLTHKSTVLHLASLTHRRTATEPHSAAFTETKTFKIGSSSGIGVLRDKILVPIQFSSSSMKGLPPSFKSYNVARQYKLIMTLGLVCEKKELEVKFEADVELVARTSEEAALERQMSLAAPPPPPPPLPPDEYEELPAYVRYA